MKEAKVRLTLSDFVFGAGTRETYISLISRELNCAETLRVGVAMECITGKYGEEQ
jgi:hypothetical protein